MIWHIHDWLYKGSAQAILDKEYLHHNIGGIILLNENNERWFPEYPMPFLWCGFDDAGYNLTGEKLRMIASFASVVHMGQFDATIKERGKKGVLVCCFGGRNRSTAICGYLLNVINHWDQNKVLETFQDGRDLNVGVRQELAQKICGVCGLNLSGLIG